MKKFLKPFIVIMIVVLSLCVVVGCGVSYTITFNSNGGSKCPSVTTDNKSAITIPHNPTKDGYDFGGWFWDNGVWQKPFTANSLLDAPLSSDMTVYAKWVEKGAKPTPPEKKLIIIFDTNGGSAIANIEVESGATITLPSAPTKSGYTFAGWYKDNKVWKKPFTVESLLETPLTGDIKLFAKWIKNGDEPITPEEKFNIVFDTNGGGAIDNIEVESGATITLPSDPTKNGYTFGGWYKDNNVWKKPFTVESLLETPLTGDIKLFAKWIKNGDEPITPPEGAFNIVINTIINGSVSASVAAALEGDTVAITVTPSEGYEQVEGSLKYNGIAIENNKFVMPASDVEITASFKKATYTVSVGTLVNGVIKLDKKTATIGDTVTLTVEPSGGYQLVAGSLRCNGTVVSGEFKMPASDVVVTASFKKITYTVSVGTFANGTIMVDKTTATPGDIITLTVDQDYGYQLVAGSLKYNEIAIENNKFIMPAGDVVIAAIFEKIGYTVNVGTLTNGSVIINNATIISGDTVTLTVKPSDGYQLVADSLKYNGIAIENNKFVMPAGDVVIAASFVLIDDDIVVGGMTYNIKGTKVALTAGVNNADVVIPTSIKYKEVDYNVTSIAGAAFENCAALASITLPQGLAIIVGWAFSGCSSLTSITLPASVTSIGYAAFNGCSALTVYAEAVSKPSDWSDIGCPIVWDCNNKDIVSDGYIYAMVDGIRYSLKDGEATVVAQSSGITVADIAASITYKEKTYTVTSIGNFAFYQCLSLASITIPASVTSIGERAFSCCSSLASITIPAGVTSIGKDAFFYCSSLASITIPAGVTSIGGYAFSGCSSLASITLPASVTSIGDSAFYNCSALASITVNSANATYKDIDGNLYSYDGATLKQYAIGKTASEFVVPVGVTSIGNSAFRNCSSLASITIPAGVTSIGDGAFEDCDFLTTVYWNMTNCTIASSHGFPIFKDCRSLRTVIFGENVQTIPRNAFEGCSSLASITLPTGVTSIAYEAFYGCSFLTTVYWNIANCTTADDSNFSIFANCPNLRTVILGENVQTIPSNAFNGCDALTTVYWNMTNYVGSSNSSIFSNCPKLTTVIFGENVQTIPNYAFMNCSTITSITIPASVTSIGYEAFYGCSSLTSIAIPASVTRIGSYAFSACRSITIYAEAANKPSGWSDYWNCKEINFPPFFVYPVVWGSKNKDTVNDGYIYAMVDGIIYGIKDGVATVVRQYGAITGADIPSNITDKEVTYAVTSIVDSAFSGCSALASITIPDGVTSIGKDAFFCCSSLASITLPASVTSIGDSAFYNCSALASITVNSANTTYKDIDGNLYSYDGATLKQYAIGKTASEFVVPVGVTSIGNSAFRNCSSLASITLPASVTSIGDSAFDDCSSLASITIPAGVTSIGGYAFSGCSSLASITLPAGVTSIGYQVFYGCSSLTSIELPAGVTSICDHAFDGCSALASITLPAGVTSIGYRAFSGCSSLTSIELPAGVTSIGDYAFSGCSSLASITIPAGVTSIGGYAFSGCSSLASITLPASVKSIGFYAFNGCSALASITVDSANTTYKDIDGNLYSKDGATLIQYAIGKTASEFVVPAGVTSIGGYAFYNCRALARITLPASVRSIGDWAFYGCSALTIYAEEASAPSGWDSYWNRSNRPVVWNCKNNDVANDGYIYTIVDGIRYGIKDGVATVVRQSSSIKVANIAASITYNGVIYTVTSICDHAFDGCSALASITLPAGVTSIGYRAFSGCSSLTIYAEAASKPDGWDVNWNSSNRIVVWDCNKKAVASDGYIYTIVDGIRYGIKDGVATVLRQSRGITVANIAASITYNGVIYAVTRISNYAFCDCIALASITLPQGLISVGTFAFANCSLLTSITIPASLTSLSDDAIVDCHSLTSITVDSANTAYKSIDGNQYSKDGAKLIKYAMGKKASAFTVPEHVRFIGGWGAFVSCRNLTKIILQQGLNAIGESAFNGCSSLTSITILEGVTGIGGWAFTSCTALESIAIPATVTWIDRVAFNNCSALTTVTFAEGSALTSIGDDTFGGCSALTSIEIPKSITNIGYGAFSRCSALKTVTIADGSALTSIGDYAFYECRSLASITLPASVTGIGSYAFADCVLIKGVTIPALVTNIGDRAFENCRSLASIKVDSSNTTYKDIDGNLYSKDGATLVQYAMGNPAAEFTIPAGVTNMSPGALSCCRYLTSIKVDPANTTYKSIDGNLYSIDGTKLIQYAIGKKETAFTIPEGVTSIEKDAFWGCSLASVTISEGVTNIDFYVFAECSALTSITIPVGVTSIGNSAFFSCDVLTIYVEAASAPDGWASGWNNSNRPVVWDYKNTDVTADGYTCVIVDGIKYGIKDGVATVFGQSSAITIANIPKNITYIGVSYEVTGISKTAFSGCSALASITLPKGIIWIGDGAFSGCRSLTSITVNSDNANYKDIDGNLYSKDGKILIQYAIGKKETAFTIPEVVTSIGINAFNGCSALASITLPASLTSIGINAFSGCSSLTSITLPASVTSIGDSAFSGCSALDTVNWNITNYTIAGSIFSDCSKLTTVVFGEKVEKIPSYAFSGCSSLTSITLPASLTSIGNSAFSGCSAITSITVNSDNANYKDIDGNLYSKDGATLMQYACGKTDGEFILPASVTSIDKKAFIGCCFLTQISVDAANTTYKAIDGNLYNYDGTTLIQYAIGKTTSEFVVPVGVTSINDYAFYGCRALTSITIPARLISIGSYAFAECSSITSITIPREATSIGGSAFSGCSALTIYAEVANELRGWDSGWNSKNSPVVWNCNNKALASDGYINTIVGGVRYALKDGVATVVEQPSTITVANIAAIITYRGLVYAVTTIRKTAFSGCYSLDNITVDSENTTYKSIDGNLYSKDGTKLIQYAIGKTAKEFVVPAGVTSIGINAFSGCNFLTSIVISAEVTNIGWRAFNECYSLTNIAVNSANTAYKDIDGNLYSKDGAKLIQYAIGKTASEFVVTAGVTIIDNDAFAGCLALTSIVITRGVTSIGGNAFLGCSSLTKITIPREVTSVGYYAFYGCSALKIYAEVANKPNGWSSYWNSSNRPVVWDYKNK